MFYLDLACKIELFTTYFYWNYITISNERLSYGNVHAYVHAYVHAQCNIYESFMRNIIHSGSFIEEKLRMQHNKWMKLTTNQNL